MEDVKMVCDICDEFIRICKYENTASAYARHCQTPYHLEVEGRFRSIKLGGCDASFPGEPILSSVDVPKSKPAKLADFSNNKSYSLFFCRLCQIDVNDSATMMRHLESEKHTKLESFVKDLSIQRELRKLLGFSQEQDFLTESKEILSYFSNVNSKGVRICLVCDDNVFGDEYHLVGHVNGDVRHRIKFNSLFMNVGKDFNFYCLICNAINKGEANMNEHCGGVQHRSAIELLYKFSRHGIF